MRLPGEEQAETTGSWIHKISVVQRALEVNSPDPDNGLDVLRKVGGFEIGVLAGVVLGGALARRVVVLDGFVSGAAALICAQSMHERERLRRCCPHVGRGRAIESFLPIWDCALS